MGYRIGLTEAAEADLGAVVRFLAAKSPEAAVRIGNELIDAARWVEVVRIWDGRQDPAALRLP